MKLEYRSMTLEECRKIDEIDPSHYIKRAWRNVDGKRQLINLDYHEKGYPEGYESTLKGLCGILEQGGMAYGAFDETNKLHGFVSLDKRIFGKTAKYMLLDAMFVSQEDRGLGIGKRLFRLCGEEVLKEAADRLYICAGSAEDTVAFYRKLGCVEATEINQVLYEEDPRDLQLEYDVRKRSS